MLMSALDQVLNKITRIVFEHEQEKRRLRAEQRAQGLPVEAEVQLPGKTVKFRAGSAAERSVKEPLPDSVALGKGLTDYLALPLDQYSLLDPRWITRPDAANAPDVFVLKVPLQELMHVALQPQVTIKVTVDPRESQVRFEARSFQVGDKRFDACFNLDMDAKLSHRPPAKPSLGQGMVETLRSWKRGLAMATGTHPEASMRSLSSLDDPSHPSTLMLPQPSASDAHAFPSQPSASSSSSSAASSTAPAAPPLTYDPHPTMRPLHAQQPQQAPQQPAQDHPHHATTAAAPTPIVPVAAPAAAAAAAALHAGAAAAAPDGAPQAPAAAPLPQDSEGAAALAVTPPPPPAEAGSLHCEVDLHFNVTLPSPLSVVPGPMLALAGSLLARFAVRALLPGFLELLSVDYSRWAAGSSSRGREAAGSLLATAPPTQDLAHNAGVTAAAAGGTAQAQEAVAGGPEDGYVGGGAAQVAGARLGTAMAGFAAAVGVSASASGAPPPGA